jgi:predicted RNA-binding protein
MCLARVWVAGDNAEKPLMEDVAYFKAEGDKVVLTSLFGEQQELAATVQEIDFTKSVITLSPTG